MSNLSNLASAGGLAATVYGITGHTEDSAAAAGYGAWVESVTGSYPSVGKTLDGKAQVSLSQGQIVAMQQWLDSQIQSTVFSKGGKSDSTLDIQFGPVIGPLAAKYVIFILAAGFLAGWFGHRIMRK